VALPKVLQAGSEPHRIYHKLGWVNKGKSEVSAGLPLLDPLATVQHEGHGHEDESDPTKDIRSGRQASTDDVAQSGNPAT
jgi:hypothetical protein